MSLVMDCYWSFRSPYSYLAVKRLREWQRIYDIKINIRLVSPLAVRVPGFFKQQRPQWLSYLIVDCAREAEYLGIPLAAPNPDPIVMNLATGDVAEQQPLIERLNMLGMAAVEAGQALAFIDEVSQLIWSGEVSDWHQGGHLAAAAQRAGLDLAQLEGAVEKNASGYQRIIKQHEEQQLTAGHWGVPLFVFNGEAFFGQDRMAVLLWRMQQQGLKMKG